MGVYWEDKMGKWKIEFKIGGKVHYFGAHISKEVALRQQERIRPRVEKMRAELAMKKNALKGTKPSPTRATGYKSPNNPWTLTEVAYLREHIDRPTKEIAQALNRSINSVHAAKWRIRRDEVM